MEDWDVSNVPDMWRMFKGASRFDANLSEWDVSRVTNMHEMFRNAVSFKQTLCGKPWVTSEVAKAQKYTIFVDSNGAIASTICGTWTIH